MKQFLESSDFLHTIVVEAGKNSDEAGSLVAGLSDPQLCWTSAPNSWSIAQCLDHLATTSKAFEPYLTAASKRGRCRVARKLCDPLQAQLGGRLANQTGRSRSHEESAIAEGLSSFTVSSD